jgi:hypothetical protein
MWEGDLLVADLVRREKWKVCQQSTHLKTRPHPFLLVLCNYGYSEPMTDFNTASL